MYLLLESLAQNDITKRKTIYSMKLYEIFDYIILANSKEEIEELSKSKKDGSTYF